MKAKEPIWLHHDAVLAAHLAGLREHGGSAGLRDEGLLDSALGRARNLFAYERADVHRLAAAYAHGIAKNRPFIDGNKRTAFLAAAIFLERNGWQLTADPAHAAVFVLGLAAGEISEGAFADWLRDNSRSRARPAPRKKRKPR